MENKEIVFQLIHNPQMMLALSIILDKRIEELKDELTFAEVGKVVGLQRAIAELRRLKSLKEIITAEKRNG